MSKKPQRTTPDFALNSPVHIKALGEREETLWAWKRNVIDEFKELSNDEIRNRLKETAFPFSVLVENLLGDFNLSSVMRNLNAFNGDALFYTGDKKIDRRGMMGVHNYSDLFWLPTIDALKEVKRNFNKVVAVDNVPGAIPFRNSKIVPETLFIFGNEGVGITKDMLEMADEVVYVPQMGSVRSINVACCSAIIMERYTSEIQKQHLNWLWNEEKSREGGGIKEFRQFHRAQKLQAFK